MTRRESLESALKADGKYKDDRDKVLLEQSVYNLAVIADAVTGICYYLQKLNKYFEMKL